VAKQCQALWNFPHSIGAIDGKHVVLRRPRNSVSDYFNYKNVFSAVLFALVDANYNFMFVDAECQGRISDRSVFANTELYKNLERKTICLPQPVPLNGREKSVPYYFIEDEAFPLRESHECLSGTTSKGLKRTNFQLRNLQSPKSCRKCIWLRVISVPSVSKTSAFGTRKNLTRYNDYCLLTQFLNKKP
jgi:hypothetical protein